MQTLENATAMTHNGQAADLTQTVTLRPEKGRYADQTFTWRFPISQSLGLDGDALAQGAALSLADSLTLRETLPNTAQERQALESAGIQYTLYRDTLYAFAPLSALEGATLTATVENGEAVLTLCLDGDALTPGWRTFRLSLNIPRRRLGGPRRAELAGGQRPGRERGRGQVDRRLRGAGAGKLAGAAPGPPRRGRNPQPPGGQPAPRLVRRQRRPDPGPRAQHLPRCSACWRPGEPRPGCAKAPCGWRRPWPGWT